VQSSVLPACSYDGAGAVWDICARGDAAAQLSSYLQEHAGDFTHQGSPVSADRLPVVGHNAMFSQAFMMSQGHREALQRERGVQLWHFEQHRGEAVFIPGGCPHQVRNLASCCKVRRACLTVACAVEGCMRAECWLWKVA
jgi:lysine-specific demethylase 3